MFSIIRWRSGLTAAGSVMETSKDRGKPRNPRMQRLKWLNHSADSTAAPYRESGLVRWRAPEAELEVVQSVIDLLGLRWSEDHAIFPGRFDGVTRTMFLAPKCL
jgi:hypothetical protein